jgi:hypothetical protein
VWTVKRNTALETVIGSTYTDSTELQVALVAGTYTLRIYAAVIGSGNGAKVQLNYSGTVTNLNALGFTATGVGTTLTALTAAAVPAFPVLASGSNVCSISAIVRITVSTSGVFSVQFASQGTSPASADLRIGSFLEITP